MFLYIFGSRLFYFRVCNYLCLMDFMARAVANNKVSVVISRTLGFLALTTKFVSKDYIIKQQKQQIKSNNSVIRCASCMFVRQMTRECKCEIKCQFGLGSNTSG